MNSNINVLISIASWEDRFIKGIEDILTKYPKIERVILFYTRKYSNQSQPNRDNVSKLCRQNNIEFSEYEIDLDQAALCWKEIRNSLINHLSSSSSRILFDITTSPREILWFVLHHLRILNCEVHYNYFKPISYGNWQSRNAMLPRLVFQRSGISLPDRQTLILAITGFNADRILQIMHRFEPSIVLLGVQCGEQFDNINRNKLLHNNQFNSNPKVKFFEIDSYTSIVEFVKIIQLQLNLYIDTHNILVSSLGPKLSAVGLFKLTEDYHDIGLIYTPSSEYNLDYSVGINKGQRYTGLVFTSRTSR